MNEQEAAAQDFARQLFGSPPEEPKDEPEPTNDKAKEPESKVEAESTEPEPADPSTPEERHNQFLTAMFRGSPAKREADEQFFRTMHPPAAEKGKEAGE
jgi:hypothetical protein